MRVHCTRVGGLGLPAWPMRPAGSARRIAQCWHRACCHTLVRIDPQRTFIAGSPATSASRQHQRPDTWTRYRAFTRHPCAPSCPHLHHQVARHQRKQVAGLAEGVLPHLRRRRRSATRGGGSMPRSEAGAHSDQRLPAAARHPATAAPRLRAPRSQQARRPATAALPASPSTPCPQLPTHPQ